MNRIGIDVGGTFTDVVLVDDESGRIWSAKVPTTPADRVIGAMNGFHKILDLSGKMSHEIGFIGHGTTMATNMIVEGKGAKTALITTKGFRDILEIRRVSRHDRADLYDLQFENPKPLVDRRWRLEIQERTRADGSIETPLNLIELNLLANKILESDIEAVAICFMHSYVNAHNEESALEELKRRLPNHFLTASYQVNPEMQEYERTSSTVINAMLGPVCGHYIDRFSQQLRSVGFLGELLFMQSNGGLASASVVSAKPIVLLESGPAGGVSAAVRTSEQAKIPGVLLGDMGGTTFDVSLIRDSKPEIRTSGLLHTHAVRSPTIDIDSIGAGGGSIAWIDHGGGVHIGPESAGADPGPACYGRGGTRPTVTDCNLLLGYVDPDSFLGGEFRLDVDAARSAVQTHLADPLGISVIEAAWTVRVVANALMAQAMRLMTVERGFDPRELTYMCYGGAGPVHAIDLAEELEIKTVIVPPLPGLFSAFGMIVADRLFDGQTAVETELNSISAERILVMCNELKEQASQSFGQENQNATVEYVFRADCRYTGQPSAISVVIPSEQLQENISTELIQQIRERFEVSHKRMWNFIKKNQPVVLVNLRVQATVRSGWRGVVRQSKADGIPELTPKALRSRLVYMAGSMQSVPTYLRSSLAVGAQIVGPAIIEEQSSCIIFKVGQIAQVDSVGNLCIALKGE